MISFVFYFEKWHNKTPKALRFRGFPNRYLFRFALLVAGAGFDGLCPSFASRTPDFVRLRREGSNPFLCKKQKTPYWVSPAIGCGGGIWTTRPPGYEPDELPSCSTPRYIHSHFQSALLLYINYTHLSSVLFKFFKIFYFSGCINFIY